MSGSEGTIQGAKCLALLPTSSPMCSNKVLHWLSTYFYPQVSPSVCVCYGQTCGGPASPERGG